MKISRFSKVIITVSVVGWIFIGLLLVDAVSINASNTNNQGNIYQKIKLFNEVLFKLQENYVEDIDVGALIDAAITGMLDNTDPHTVYFTPDEYENFSSSTKGEFGGLGISIDKKGDYITVVSPIEGTPAYLLGIQAGDKIIKVDDENVIGISTDEVIKKMRGDKGTKVTLTILRPGVENELEFEIIRDIIKIESIPYAFKLDNGVGYIRIRQFNANTTRELREKLDELEAQDIRGLLIDLRYNPGGLLNEAVDTVNEFIGKGKRVVFTKGRIDAANIEYITQYNRMRSGYPVVVLINEASASASEIFAGSLQDWDRGLVVGKTSFGKGSVQRLFRLSDGNGLKVTTAKYYINSGRCIHKELNDKLFKDERIRNGSITEEELVELQEDADQEHLKEIFYTENGRIVYGGGGINPDIEIEQSRITPFGVELRRNNAFFDFSVEYMLEHEQDITSDFAISDETFHKFLDFVRNEGIEYETSELDSTMTWIKNELAYNIVSRKFGLEEGYRVLIKEDIQLQEALILFDRFSSLEEMFAYASEMKVAEKK
ncbi:MAG: S41 family peptidase [Candidatus Cloacimonetes bacterium]|nr:S41 family peptidase [Candidatus Cloacimonadota bacterium]